MERFRTLERLPGLDQPFVPLYVGYSCIYAPDSVVDMPGLIRIAEAAVKAQLGGERILGAVLYRAGRYEEALERFDQSHKVSRPRVSDRLFLAMIHHRLGHRDQARRLLAQAGQRLANTGSTDRVAGGDRLSEWLGEYENESAIRLLLREAEAVILLDPVFPMDPFAPA
jgi:hypothetical protein